MNRSIITTLAIAILVSGIAAASADAGPGTGWQNMPVLPSLKGQTGKSFLKDLARSKRRGMRPRVFSKVGDSNTEMTSALYGLGCRKPQLYGRTKLQAVIDRYNQVLLPNPRAFPDCAPWTSFSRRSDAAQSGVFTTWLLKRIGTLPSEGLWKAPSDCLPEQTPVSCELLTLRPRYSLIMIGTNDYALDKAFDIPPAGQTVTRLSAIIDTIRRIGSVPVISTLPPLMTAGAPPDAIDPYNAAIVRAARLKGVPVINLWRALESPGMVNSGLEDPGLHLRVEATGESPIVTADPTSFQDSVDFSPSGLTIGSNRRNLVWLQTLAKLDLAAGVTNGRGRGRSAMASSPPR